MKCQAAFFFWPLVATFVSTFRLTRVGTSLLPKTVASSVLYDKKGSLEEGNVIESMYSASYDILELPTSQTEERDLEDVLRQRAMRFYDRKLVRADEKCYLVGLEDKSQFEARSSASAVRTSFSLEESLTELSELAGAAGLSVVGSTYQQVSKPNIEFFIGPGKVKEIARAMGGLQCTCVVFDAELSPSQQKNLELAFNKDNLKDAKNSRYVKVIDRSALILDIFAQHARTREGQLQVELALLTYRLPRLTNMWSHLERQTSSSKGKSNGGVGLRGPGEKQLESDRRVMKKQISYLNDAINAVKTHRAMHRERRRGLGVPVIALVGYTNSGKSTLLNALTLGDSTENEASNDHDFKNNVHGKGKESVRETGEQREGGVFVADMLFATLDPTTRMMSSASEKLPDVLITDTVGFIQKLPTQLVAAFRATLEEIHEADVLLHVIDISNEAWSKQEAAVLSELNSMGLSHKPVITVYNKIDLLPQYKEYIKHFSSKRPYCVALSANTKENVEGLNKVLEEVLTREMLEVTVHVHHRESSVVSLIYRLGAINSINYTSHYAVVNARIPPFLYQQLMAIETDDKLLAREFEYTAESTVDISFESSNKSDLFSSTSLLDHNNKDHPVDSNGVEEEMIRMMEEGKELEGVFMPRIKIRPLGSLMNTNLIRQSSGSGNDNAFKAVENHLNKNEEGNDKEVGEEAEEDDIDWKSLAKGRHTAVKKYKPLFKP